MIDLDQAILADLAAEAISRDRVLKLRASQDSFKQSMEKLRGLSYVGFSLPNKDTGAKRREAKLAIDTRFELLSKMKTARQQLFDLYEKTVQHHDTCTTRCECPKLLDELESHYEKLHAEFSECYSQIGKLGKIAYGAE